MTTIQLKNHQNYIKKFSGLGAYMSVVGGGFARGIVLMHNGKCQHEKKMLYDNGQLICLCKPISTYQTTTIQKAVVQNIAKWIENEMTDEIVVVYIPL